jgi:hypothetical protein
MHLLGFLVESGCRYGSCRLQNGAMKFNLVNNVPLSRNAGIYETAVTENLDGGLKDKLFFRSFL